MISHNATDELHKTGCDFLLWGKTVGDPEEVLALDATALIAQDEPRIADLYSKASAELTANLTGPASVYAKKRYLRALRATFCDGDVLPAALQEVAALRAELSHLAFHAPPLQLANIPRFHACFQIQSICLAARKATGRFTNRQLRRLGQCYLIATNGDQLIGKVVHEVHRQLLLLEANSADDSTDVTLPTLASRAAEEFQELFALNFTVQHCDELMKKVHVGPAYRRPTNLGAKIWALLDVLYDEHHRLLTCRPLAAAPIAGNYFGYSMAIKPSKARRGGPYQEAHAMLERAVRNAIATKKYGPNYS